MGHHRKKLSGRRLDYDYKRKKGAKAQPDEIVQAEQKLEESLELADNSMYNLLSGDVEQVSQLAALVEVLVEYHRHSCEILESLSEKLQARISTINSQPYQERKSRHIAAGTPTHEHSPVGTPTSHAAPMQPTKVSSSIPEQPSARGMYLFEAENEGELGFKEGEVLTLISKIDDNWYEGMNDGGDSG